MSHRAIIEDLAQRIGSQALLAEALGVVPSRLPKWKLVGIPPRHWPVLLRIAKRYRYRLNLDQFEACSPRKNGRPPAL